MCVILQLYGLNKEKLNGLKQYKDYCIESELSTGDKTLSFLYPANLATNIVEEGYIRNKTDEFIIKEISIQGDWKTIKANLNVEDLEGKVFESFNTVNKNITECINLALAGTGWIVGTCDVTKRRTVRKTNSNSWEIIQEAKSTYNCELEFDTLNKRINIYEKRGADKGVYFLDSLNLKDLSIQGDSYDFYTRIIAKGKDDLKVTLENFQYSNKVKTYIWKDERYTDIESLTEDAEAKLDELSKPYRAYSATVIDLANISKENYKDILSYGLGDVITLVSKENGLKEKQRIVKMVEYPEEPTRNTCEIANTTLSFEDVQKEFQDTTDTVNNITTDNGTIDGSTIDGISTDQIYDFEANVAKITDLTAVKADIEELYAEKANIGELNAVVANVAELNVTKANITDLTAINADIENLKADKADIGELTATKAEITDLIATKAEIKDLQAATADIGTLKATVADVTTLVSGNISSENIQTGGITGSNLNMETIFVNDANIINVNASKINTGSINTNEVTIQSENGGIIIADNTQQFKDKNGKVRVQIGQDESGDFNFGVFDSTGSGVLIDANGVKEKALADGIIKDRMIGNGEINGSKIDINSLITEVNKDTNTNSIKGSKVLLDTQGQKLDVAFNSLKSQADATKTQTESNTTQLGIEQGKINTLIQDTTIVKDGQSLKLKDEYSKLEQTVSGIKTTVGQQTTTITEVGQKADSANSKIDDLQVGSRNLWIKNKTTGYSAIEKLGDNHVTGQTECYRINNNATLTFNIEPDYSTRLYRKVTFSAWVKYENVVQGTNAWNVFNCFKHALSRKNSSTGATTSTDYTTLKGFTGTSGWKKIEVTYDYSSNTSYDMLKTTLRFNVEGAKSGIAWVTGIKVEFGNKATDWTPAPEDIDSAIGEVVNDVSTLTGKVTTVENNYSTLSQDLSGFKTTVGNTYSTKSELSSVDGKVTSLTSRVGTTESNITQLNNKIALKVEATDITTAINNVKVGGDNVLRNGNFANGTSNWSTHDMNSGGTSKAIAVENGDGVWKPTGKKVLVIKGTNTVDRYGVRSSTIKLIPNTKYTVSGYCAGHRVSKIQVNVRDVNNSDANIFTQNLTPVTGGATLDKWYRFELTFTTTSNTDFALNLYSVNMADNGYVWFSDVQIQIGTKATAWTPCAEDIDSAITSVDSKITTTSNKVATIETNLNSITQRVSSTESTVSTHNTQLGTVDSRINTAKTSAISTAASDATSKANAAQTNATNAAKTYTDGQISTVNKIITDKVAEIKTTTDSITSRVSKAETTLTSTTTTANNALNTANSANSKIEGLEVGGRNLATETNKGTTGWSWSLQTGGKTISEISENGIRCCKMLRDSVASTGWSYIGYSRIGRNKYLPSRKYTVSFEVKASIATKFTVCIQCGNATNQLTNGANTQTTIANTWTKLSATITTVSSLPSDTSQVLYLYGMDSSVGVSYIFRNLKIEEGTKPSNWTPSPEDVDSEISNLTTRMSSAEQKITDGAIISTVQSTINTAKTEAINSANSSTDNKLKNYSTTTQMNTAIQQKADSITSTVSSNYLSKSDATNTYATKSSLTQTTDKIVADFKSTGGYNLLKNSDAKNGTSYWISNGGGISIGTAGVSPFNGQNEFKTSFPNGIRYNEDLRLKANTDYVYEAWIYTNTAISSSSITPLHFWCSSEAGTSGQAQCTIVDYRQTLTTGAYTKVYVHFKTKAGNVFFRPFIYSSATSSSICVKQVSLSEAKVEQSWSPHPDEVYSGSTVIDASGVTVNNGALRVKNNAGTTVLEGDSSGNLTMKNGCFKVLSSSSSEIASINQNNWMRIQGLELFGAGECMQNKGSGVRSMKLISTDGKASHIDFNENSSVEYTVRLIREANSKSLTVLGNGMTLLPYTANTACGLEMRSQANWAFIDFTSNSTDDYHARLYLKNNDKNIYTAGTGLIVQGNLNVTGSKNCLQATKNYGERLINAYETAEYYFGDLGFGKINSDGECLINIDDIFQECINTDVEYHVFTQVYNGSIKTIERYKTYFIVKGDPETNFSWEIKAKRIGHENNRLDLLDIDNFTVDGIKTFKDEDLLAETAEDTLLDILTFDLEKILMEE